MMPAPEVSVLIANYYCASYIEQALRSALDQTMVALEAIVVDDASTEPMPEDWPGQNFTALGSVEVLYLRSNQGHQRAIALGLYHIHEFTDAEAVVVMRPELVADTRYLRKQQLQLASKMRFLSAQFLALLDDDLWRRSADHANKMAQRLARGVENLPGVDLTYPTQSDAVFARLDPKHIEALQRDWYFYVWDEDLSVVRWMTAFDTTEADVDTFLRDIRSTAST